MNPYIVYLTDLLSVLNPVLYTQIYMRIKAWFDPIARGAGFTDSQVFWLPALPPVTDTQLLVHFLPTELTIAGQLAGRTFDPLAQRHWGYTAWATPPGQGTEYTCSEVYVKDFDPEILSKLAFHECMHNKLHLGNRGLHPNNRVEPALGLASGELDHRTNLIAANTTAMASGLRTSHPQWTEAWDRLKWHRDRRDKGDPLWYQ